MNSTFKCLRKESQHYSVNCVSNHALLHSINDTWCTHNIVNIVWIHKFWEQVDSWHTIIYNLSHPDTGWNVWWQEVHYVKYIFSSRTTKIYRQVHISILSSSYSNHFFYLYTSSIYSNLSLRWDKNKTEKIFFELEK